MTDLLHKMPSKITRTPPRIHRRQPIQAALWERRDDGRRFTWDSSRRGSSSFDKVDWFDTALADFD
jgi:hypothetical protein